MAEVNGTNGTQGTLDPFSRLLSFRCEAVDTALCDITRWLWRTVPYLLVVIGTVGSAVSLSVLCRKTLRRQSTAMYLMVLAVSDTTVLWTAVLNFSKVTTDSSQGIQDLSDFACAIYSWLVSVPINMSHWLLCVVTLERLIVTKYPQKAQLVFSRKTSSVVIASLITIVLLYNAHLLLGFRRRNFPTNMIVGNMTYVHSIVVCDFSSESYASFFLQIHAVTNSLLVFFIPIFLVLSGNLMTAWLLRRQKQKVAPSLRSNSNNVGTTSSVNANENSYVKRTRGITVTLVLVGIVFVVCSSPVLIFLQIAIATSASTSDNEFAIFQLFYFMFSFLALCNYTFNFLLYFAKGNIFRKEFNLMKQELVTYMTTGIDHWFPGGQSEAVAR